MPSTATSAQKFLLRLMTRLGLARDWYLVLVAAFIGLLMAGVAMAFILPLRFVEQKAESFAHDPTLWVMAVIVFAPVVGGLLAGAIVHVLPVRSKGLGVSAVMYAIHRQQSRLPLKMALSKWLSSSLTIGSGGSAGPEGPIVTIGSAIGASLADWLRANPQTRATLLGCAAAAGISSVFNAPIAGIFFVLEVLLRDFSLRTFTPIVISSVISAATTQTVLQNSRPLFGIGPGFFHNVGDRFTVIQTPNYVMLGVVCGLASVAFIRVLVAFEERFSRLKIHPIIKPGIGGAVLGLLGLLYLVTGSFSEILPPFYGTGYPVIERLLSPGTYTMADGSFRPVWALAGVLALLAVVKVLATSITLGSGGSGGLFAPALVLGAAVGAAFGHLVAGLGWFPSASPAHYALVGMAAMVAATTHAPMTGILIVYEVTRIYDIILPIMLAAVISTVVGRLLFKDSIYTVKLSSLGVRLGSMGDLTVLRRMTVRDVSLLQPITVKRGDPATRLLELTEQTGAGDFVVVDDVGDYLGMVTGVDLRSALVYREALPLLQVADLVRRDLPTVAMDEPLDLVLDRFSEHDVHCLVVTDGRKPAGIVARSRLMRRYQTELERD